MKSFVEKYKPKSTKEIPQLLESLKAIIRNKKHAILYGPTGSCKTTAVHAIAKELDYEIIEINASDFRTKDQIETIIGQASLQQSLFQKEKILLIDEIDCLAGVEDRGGAQAIVNVLKFSKFPVILTTNDLYNDKIKEIKKLTINLEFKPINNKDIVDIIKNICEKEQIKFTEESLKKIAFNSKGDLRASINDLQCSITNKELIPIEQTREYETDIMQILNTVLKTKSFDAHKILQNTDIELDEYLLWLDENLPLEYKDQDSLLKAYEYLSKADVFKGRIRKWQEWRLMYYQSLMASSGISLSKTVPDKSFSIYKRSMRPLRIWQMNMKNAKRKTIAKKIAKETHTSIKEVIKNFKCYHQILKNPEIQTKLKLDEEEIMFLEK